MARGTKERTSVTPLPGSCRESLTVEWVVGKKGAENQGTRERSI